MTVFKWSQTAADNDDADTTINLREGWSPRVVNDSIRSLMAAVAKWRDDRSGNLVTGGTATAFTVTTNQSYSALTDGITVTARMSATSGATPTLNVDGLGAKSIATVYGTAIPTGALLSGGIYTFVYDSTDDKWIVEGRFGDGYGSSSTPDLYAIEALAATSGVLHKTAANTWALDGDITDLAATTANRLYGTDGSGAAGEITVGNGVAVASGALALDVSGLTADTNPDTNADYLASYDASASAHKKLLLSYMPGCLLGIVEEQSAPGSLTTSSWTKRALDTEVYDRLGIISLSSDQITISAAGAYEISWEVQFNGQGKYHTRLYDVTGGAVVTYGTHGGWSGGSGAADAVSTGIFRVAPSASNVYRIEYYSTTSGSGGLSSFSGGTTIYSRVVIRRG